MKSDFVENVKKFRQNIENLEKHCKTQAIRRQCGKSYVKETIFNSKLNTHNLLPIRSGTLNTTTCKVRHEKR